MCGLAGVLFLRARGSESASLEVLGKRAAERMLDAPSLGRRGPDHRALLEVRGPAGEPLGSVVSTRLAITDHLNEKANMPLVSADGRLVIAFNGQIYNHRELRDELAGSFAFRTRSDTEVILAAYSRWGDALFERLEGMYAFCLIDRSARKALLAVDHAGQKPLYYYQDRARRVVVFASDIDSMLASGLVPFELDVPALQELVVERYVRDERTHLKNVRKLVNGTYAAIALDELSDVQLERHFVFPVDETGLGSVDAAAEALGAAIVEADERVVRGCELPPAYLLSSGVDSSGVLALATRHPGSVPAYVLGFPSADSSGVILGETAAASSFLGWLGRRSPATISQHDVLLEREQFATLIERWSLDNPHLLYNRDGLFLYHLFSAVREGGYKVAVTGCGPDELFDGYSHGMALEAAAKDDYPLELAHYSATRLQGELDLGKLLFGDEGGVAWRIAEKIARVRALYPKDVSPLQTAQLINWHTRSQYECLKSDIASSHFGIEGRKPYYARSVVELAFRFPGAWKRKDHHEKWIFRRALERQGILPAAVAYRAKLAFPHPAEFGPTPSQRERMSDLFKGQNPLRRADVVDVDVVVEHFERQAAVGEQLSEMFYGLCLSLEKQRQIAEIAGAELAAPLTSSLAAP